VFTTPDGAPLHPDYLTRRFGRLVKDSGLPPVRLHDLRHGAATLAHAAGADLKTVQELLGHASIVLTADTCTSVLLELQFKTAEATARLVLAAAARNPAKRTAVARLEPRRSPQCPSSRPGRSPSVRSDPAAPDAAGKARPRTSHPRPTKIKIV
jgi:hypothetical protein